MTRFLTSLVIKFRSDSSWRTLHLKEFSITYRNSIAFHYRRKIKQTNKNHFCLSGFARSTKVINVQILKYVFFFYEENTWKSNFPFGRQQHLQPNSQTCAFETLCKCFSHPLPCFSILAQDMSSQHMKMKWIHSTGLTETYVRDYQY